MFLFSQKIICPYCLSEIRSYKAPSTCPVCRKGLPPQYIHAFEQHLPFFIQVVGWSQAGKTVFLQALTLILTRMMNVWPDYNCLPITDASQEKIKDIRVYLEKGKMPASTLKLTSDKQDVYIMLLNNMERWGSRALVTSDCAGEIFDTMNVPTEYAPYLLKAPTTFMLIGPEDDQSNEGGKSMDLLLGSYINTLMSKGINFEKSRRKIVVVFTKADRIRHLPPNLQHYLEEDPIWAAINTRGSVAQMEASHMQEYIEVMGHVSDAIKEWITRDAFGKSFVRLAASKNIDLRFSLISSTGEGVNSDGTMVSKLAPRRVLDPYFWALEMQSEIS